MYFLYSAKIDIYTSLGKEKSINTTKFTIKIPIFSTKKENILRINVFYIVMLNKKGIVSFKTTPIFYKLIIITKIYTSSIDKSILPPKNRKLFRLD